MIRKHVLARLVIEASDVVSPLDQAFQCGDLLLRIDVAVAADHQVVIRVLDDGFDVGC